MRNMVRPFFSFAKVFAENSECGGNAIMFAMTQYGLKLLEGESFTSPVATRETAGEELC